MQKKLLLSILGLAVVGYLGTVGYLHSFDQSQADKLSAQSKLTQAEAKAVEHIFYKNGCQYCHSTNAELPFYQHFPIISDMLKKDIAIGAKTFLLKNITDNLETPENISTADLSKLEFAIKNDRMPIASFIHMHWGSKPDDNEKAQILAWLAKAKQTREYTAPNDHFIAPIPDQLTVNQQKAELGNILYHDGRLSGDGSISCSTCHQLDKGGVDGLDTSTGIFEQKGGINAPTVYNAAFNFVQFWDGRAKDLADQAGGPPLNPVEMGSHNWEEIVAKLEQDDKIKALFAELYPEINKASITDAIAEFEKRLITPNGPFDRYLKGDQNALKQNQVKGYQLFREYRCDTCHSGVNMGGNSFEAFGIYGDYYADRGTEKTEADQGRYAQTKQDYDMHRFKVPSLRNIALTAPYFHDASAKTLTDAVKTMAKYQVNKQISEADAKLIVDYLNSLTGELEGKPLTPAK